MAGCLKIKNKKLNDELMNYNLHRSNKKCIQYQKIQPKP